MHSSVLEFLKEARVEEIRQGLDDLGAKQFQDLYELKPIDIDALQMKVIPRRRFERMLKERKALAAPSPRASSKDNSGKPEASWDTVSKRDRSWEQHRSWRRHPKYENHGWSKNERRHSSDWWSRDESRTNAHDGTQRRSSDDRWARSNSWSRNYHRSRQPQVYTHSSSCSRSCSRSKSRVRNRGRSRSLSISDSIPEATRQIVAITKGTKAGNNLAKLPRWMRDAVLQAFRPNGDVTNQDNVSRQLAGLIYYAGVKRRVIIVRIIGLPDPWTLPLGGLTEENVYNSLSEFGDIDKVVCTYRKVHQLPLDAIDAMVEFHKPKGALDALGNIPGLKLTGAGPLAKVKTAYYSSNHEDLDVPEGHPGNFTSRRKRSGSSSSRERKSRSRSRKRGQAHQRWEFR
eukprot:gnl/MRDRNA2_/MRDRNA2_143458_c0_seq1.p1 gnl/MRDRNA2_/MRDRNA2_143458_c0~~gnl/MRDRNA2_/MRDRNA2_143458_c0_seq1.p1  ORF type:complete len:401 (-),score=51.55 gnl/MRDRNA2_/MRDRNA2_143458_c0_seq1:18-1220(-)